MSWYSCSLLDRDRCHFILLWLAVSCRCTCRALVILFCSWFSILTDFAHSFHYRYSTFCCHGTVWVFTGMSCSRHNCFLMTICSTLLFDFSFANLQQTAPDKGAFHCRSIFFYTFSGQACLIPKNCFTARVKKYRRSLVSWCFPFACLICT